MDVRLIWKSQGGLLELLLAYKTYVAQRIMDLMAVFICLGVSLGEITGVDVAKTRTGLTPNKDKYV